MISAEQGQQENRQGLQGNYGKVAIHILILKVDILAIRVEDLYYYLMNEADHG